VCLLVIGHYLELILRDLLSRAGLWAASTVLVGGSKACRRLANLLASRPDFGLVPVGFIRTGKDGGSRRPPVLWMRPSADGNIPRAPLDVDVALFTNAKDIAVASQRVTFGPSCRFMLAETVGDVQSLWLRTRSLGRMVAIEIRRDLCRPSNRVVKRAFDLLVAVPISLLVLPAVALIAVGIKLVDSGPAFYVQTRIGRNGRSLRVLKLRTMFVDAEQRLEEHLARDPQAAWEWQRFCKLRRDPRILPWIGNFIRRSSLDEVPQLWNVIRGDMSLVGPRPLPAYHAEKFDPEFRALRSGVTPGITGLWQVSARSDGDLRVLKEMDLFYIRNWSLWLDVYILVQTVPAVLAARGAR
jgi:Undecaprenyl-phosphate galactose phosphotransferase WbaP